MPINQETISDSRITTWLPATDALPEPSRSDRTAYSPTPGDLYDPEIAQHQAEVNDQAWAALNNPDLIPFFTDPSSELSVAQLLEAVQVIEFMQLVYMSREANRGTKNAYSYSHTLRDVSDSDDTLDTKVKLDKARIGSADPTEVLELIEELGMGSAELAKLTHIWGYRLVENLEKMRRDVRDSIESLGGKLSVEPEVKYGIISMDTSLTLEDNLSFAIAMKRKTRVGEVGDTAIYERSTFVVRIGQDSRIDPDVSAYLRSMSAHDPCELSRQILKDGRLNQEVERLLAENDFESIHPMSTTVFGRNDVNLAQLELKRKAEIPTRLTQTPELLLHIKQLGAVAAKPQLNRIG